MEMATASVGFSNSRASHAPFRGVAQRVWAFPSNAPFGGLPRSATEALNSPWNTGADTNWEDGDVKITLKDILDYSSEPQEKDPRAFEELLINVSRDPNRVDRADLGYPIVVSSKGGKPTKILDGQHRIVKAIKYNQPILVRYLDLDRAPEHFQQMFN